METHLEPMSSPFSSPTTPRGATSQNGDDDASLATQSSFSRRSRAGLATSPSMRVNASLRASMDEKDSQIESLRRELREAIEKQAGQGKTIERLEASLQSAKAAAVDGSNTVTIRAEVEALSSQLQLRRVSDKIAEDERLTRLGISVEATESLTALHTTQLADVKNKLELDSIETSHRKRVAALNFQLRVTRAMELRRKQQRIVQLEDELRKLKTAATASAPDPNTEKALQLATEDLSAERKALKKATEEMIAERKRANDAEVSLQALKARTSTILADAEGFTKRHEEIRNENEQLKRDLEKAEKTATVSKQAESDATRRLTAENERLQDGARRDQATLQELRVENASLQTDIRARSAERGAQPDSAALASKLAAVTADNERLMREQEIDAQESAAAAARVRALQQQLDAADREKSQLREDLEAVEAKQGLAQSTAAEIEELRREVNKHRSAAAGLAQSTSAEVEDLRREVDKHRRAAATAQENLAASQRETRTAKQAAQEAEEDLAEARASMARLADECAESEAKARGAKREANAAALETTRLKGDVARSTADVEAAHREADDLKEQLMAAKADTVDQDTLRTTKKERDSASAEVTRLKKELSAAQDATAEAETDAKTAQAALAAMQANLSNVESSLRAVSEERGATADRLVALQKDLNTALADGDKYEHEATTATAERDTAIKRAATVEDELRQVKQELRESQTAVSTTKAEKDADVESAVRKGKAESDRLEAELQASNRSLERAKEDMARSENDAAATTKALAEESEARRRERNESNDQLTALRRSNSEATERANRAESEAAKLQSELDTAVSAGTKTAAEAASVKKELEETKKATGEAQRAASSAVEEHLTELEAEVKTLLEDNHALASALRQRDESLNATQTALRESETSRGHTEQRLTQMVTGMDEAETKIANAQRSAEDATKALRTRNAQLEDANSKLTQEVHQSTAKVAEMQRLANDRAQEIKTVTWRADAAERDHQSAIERCDRLQRDANESRQRNEEEIRTLDGELQAEKQTGKRRVQQAASAFRDAAREVESSESVTRAALTDACLTLLDDLRSAIHVGASRDAALVATTAQKSEAQQRLTAHGFHSRLEALQREESESRVELMRSAFVVWTSMLTGAVQNSLSSASALQKALNQRAEDTRRQSTTALAQAEQQIATLTASSTAGGLTLLHKDESRDRACLRMAAREEFAAILAVFFEGSLKISLRTISGDKTSLRNALEIAQREIVILRRRHEAAMSLTNGSYATGLEALQRRRSEDLQLLGTWATSGLATRPPISAIPAATASLAVLEATEATARRTIQSALLGSLASLWLGCEQVARSPDNHPRRTNSSLATSLLGGLFS